MSIYKKVEKGKVAEKAIISGDPSRVNQLAKMLEGADMVSNSGGLVAYTGLYRGKPLTVATHGIGGTSASLIINGLIKLGVKSIVRLGTAGSLKENIEVGDVIVATGAHYSPGGVLSCDYRMSPAPDFVLTKKLYQALKHANIKVHLGTVFSKNAFYTLDDLNPWLISIGSLSLEMECATLMAISNIHDVSAACALIVSDNVVKKTRMYTAAELKNFVDVASRAVMDAITS
ncbi:MAG: nucleoside phosphorylase [Nitrososphaeria archaeon]